MRACALANVVSFAILGVTLGLASCSGGAATVPPASPDGTDPAKAAAAATPPAADPAATPAATSAAVATPTKVVPTAASECKALVGSDGPAEATPGVVMNNAAPASTAAPSDRYQALSDLIKTKRPAFRCCFNFWAKKNPGVSGDVKMVFNLAPDGSVKKVSFADTASRLQAPEVEGCMVDVAKAITYPKSPSGKETTFTFPFNFTPRN